MHSASELLAWLGAIPPRERDAALETKLEIGAPLPASTSPGKHLVGYHASGVAAIVRALLEVPIVSSDVVIDLGAGLGKVAMLTRLLTGARVRGVELQSALVERARAAATKADLAIDFVVGDARTVDISEGTVFFLYAPFTGPVLAEVTERLRAVAAQHPIVVCTLGIDLPRSAEWLRPRATDSFWLAVYDSHAPRTGADRSAWGSDAERIAFER